MNRVLKFIDLFAGLGGFHHALTKTGGFKCVFASEINPQLQELYSINHGHKAEGDITQIDVESVPAHDMLCAGFPCQPFSLAGLKKGRDCLQSGRLIEHVLRIAKHRKPEFLILENVPGLLTVANGSIWNRIESEFKNLGYQLSRKVISPLDVAVPQNRNRLFVVGSLHHDLSDVFDWPAPEKIRLLTEFLCAESNSHKPVEPQKRTQLEKWQQMLTDCMLPEEMPIQSIAAPEFGATYPLDFSAITLRTLRRYRAAYGQPLSNCSSWNDALKKLPSYCRKRRKVPHWLAQSVEFSREIYKRNRRQLDEWHTDFDKRYNSWQILEWRGDRKSRQLNKHLIQFRASGIRVASPRKLPSLVAMTATQVPIIGSEMRYLSRREAARFQELHELSDIPGTDSFAFRAIGNAVNAKVVEYIASNIRRIHSTGIVSGKA